MKDVPIRYRVEEFVLDMVPRGIFVAMRDVPIMHRKEECVSGMVQR